jgi:hypothetical protein
MLELYYLCLIVQKLLVDYVLLVLICELLDLAVRDDQFNSNRIWSSKCFRRPWHQSKGHLFLAKSITKTFKVEFNFLLCVHILDA